MATDSFAILLTPPGAAAIAVVRLTGPKVAAFLDAHFSRPVPAGKSVHGTLSDGGEVLDDPVVVRAADGEGIDVNLHGGTWVIHSVLALAGRAGFRLLAPAAVPLAPEAVDADSPIEREALRWLPAAATELAIARLLDQPAAWKALRGRIAGGGDPQAIAFELDGMRADSSLFHLLHPPRVAIVGVPNVGKSTLANALFAQERSITADLPGTTRDWVGEIANLDGLAVMLVDTPGIRASQDAIESSAIARAGEEIAGADLVVLVLDPTQSGDAQGRLISQFPNAIRVVNKGDAVAAWDAAGVQGIRTVATTGAGIDLLRAAIRDRFGIGGRAVEAARWWTDGQRDAVEAANADLMSFRRWIDGQIGAYETGAL